MAEKRGNTIKLIYDFDTARCLEVKKNDKWYRVTANTFRSYGGERRIVNYTQDSISYENYTGGVYYNGTNNIVPHSELTSTTMYISEASKHSKAREHEKKWGFNV
jgi:hypothetical protein